MPKWIAKKGNVLVNRQFERSVPRHISKDTDVYVGWSGTAERGLHRAKEIGAAAFLERGSSHIEYQRDLLREEARRFDTNVNLPDSDTIEKEKREYEKADAIILPSRFTVRSFLKKGFDASKLIQVPYGVNTDQFRRVEKKDDKFRVIYAGQMNLRKGVHYLLKAFAELDLPNSELWLLGKKRSVIDPYFEKYKGYFEFLGHKPQSDLYKYYSQGTVFAICSVEEGLAMVQPQAMACGLPLVCTPNTGGEDLIREGEEGFVVPIRDVEALKEQLTWCYEHQRECRKMGEKAKRRVRNHFTWSDYADRVVESYEKLLE